MMSHTEYQTQAAALLETLSWRYAVKKFDAEKKLSEEQLQLLLEVLRLTPSSYGLQAWKFVVVENSDLRRELIKHSWNQDQVADASHLLVLCRKSSLNGEDVEQFVQEIAETRGVSTEELAGYENMMKVAVEGRTKDERAVWMEKQLYIALGNLMTACASLGIDSCPMEGFDAGAYDELLSLEEKGLNAVLVVPVGYRAEDDAYAPLAKVRKPLDELIVRI